MRMLFLTCTFLLTCIAAADVLKISNVAVSFAKGKSNSTLTLDKNKRELVINPTWYKKRSIGFDNISVFDEVDGQFVITYSRDGETKTRTLTPGNKSDHTVWWNAARYLYREFNPARERTRTLRFDGETVYWVHKPNDELFDIKIKVDEKSSKTEYAAGLSDIVDFLPSGIAQYPKSLGGDEIKFDQYTSLMEHKLIDKSGYEYLFQYTTDQPEAELINNVFQAVSLQNFNKGVFKSAYEWCVHVINMGMPDKYVTFENCYLNTENRCQTDRLQAQIQRAQINPLKIPGPQFGKYRVFTCNWNNLSEKEREWYKSRGKCTPAIMRDDYKKDAMEQACLEGWSSHPEIFERAKAKAKRYIWKQALPAKQKALAEKLRDREGRKAANAEYRRKNDSVACA